jgi:hypothetical protein
VQPSEVIKIAARCKSVRSPNCDTLLAVISNVHNDHDAEQAALLAVEGAGDNCYPLLKAVTVLTYSRPSICKCASYTMQSGKTTNIPT